MLRKVKVKPSKSVFFFSFYVQYTNNKKYRHFSPTSLQGFGLTLYVQDLKNPAVKKCLPFKLLCAVCQKYMVTYNFVPSAPNHTVIGNVTKLICTVHQEPSESGFNLILYVPSTKNPISDTRISSVLLLFLRHTRNTPTDF